MVSCGHRVHSCVELLGLCSCDVRAVRKSILRYRLWQPVYERKQTWWKTRHTTADNDGPLAPLVPTPTSLAEICQILTVECAVGR